ncbi:MAG: N-acetyl-gamma-glutamyl-phosphate reductase, partial [Candidatus Omnitrophica bacterium]|nr:N-acetyl-gamma-glutamyl-phosphate reductase [Candidatus Omnitrophota bacterium]
FSEVDESVSPYKVNRHQHIPEIEEELSFIGKKNFKIIFVPQLLPLSRGILSCVYVKLKKEFSTEELINFYKEFYRNEPFIRILEKGVYPRIKEVQFSNYCDIGLEADRDTAVVISAIDNLGKGASGQAVQNLNIMMDWEETLGLR